MGRWQSTCKGEEKEEEGEETEIFETLMKKGVGSRPTADAM